MNEKITEGLRFDFYGELLSEKQKVVLDYYYNDDYSLAEIGELVGMTRQGVFDALKRANRSMEEYENKLGLLERFLKHRDLLQGITEEISLLAEDKVIQSDDEVQKKVLDLKHSIDKIIEGY